MSRLVLEEYTTYHEDVPLDREQRRALTEAHIEVMPSLEEEGAYRLRPSSYVGAVNIGDLVVIVRPKVLIDRVMFMIAYSMDPKNWRSDAVELDRDDDILEGVALAFAHRTRSAIQRGLLQGYRREEEALNIVRGRIRFEDQISRRFGIPFPMEVAYEEFTEDIEKNRLLKTAIQRLGHTYLRSGAVRREVSRLRPAFTTVGIGSYRMGLLPEVGYTRLDEHYRPAVELARLIIENSTLELRSGEVVGAAFLVDMNKVFERFLYVALREELGLSESAWRHGADLPLDEGRRIHMKPDLSWWSADMAKRRTRLIFVGDAKYKNLDLPGFEHSDIYQTLAYCTAADLPSGLLVYAAGEGEPGIYHIREAGKTIEVLSLNLSGTPEAILREVRRIAGRVRANAHPLPVQTV